MWYCEGLLKDSPSALVDVVFEKKIFTTVC